MAHIYRGAVIGCGFFAHNHLHAWAQLTRVKIVAVCDQDAEKARTVATRFKVDRWYSSAAELFAHEQIDFVDIITTSPTHRALVEVATSHARLVICQKPMAETLADGQAMVAAAQQAGVQLLIHENFRWQRPFQEIARLIAAGKIGPPHFARLSFRHGYDNYQNQPYLARIERFAVMDLGLHLFDLARHLIGEVNELSARTQRLNPIVRGEDAFTIMLGHENGATSVVDCSFFTKLTPHRFPQTTAWVEGPLGTIELGEDYQLTVHDSAGRSTLGVEPLVPAWGEKPWHVIQDSVIAFERHVLEVLDGIALPQPSGADNLKSLALALAAYESAAPRHLTAPNRSPLIR